MKYTENYEVDLEAFEKMYETIGDLLDEEFGVDCDHDSNVEVILIDRQRTHSLHYDAIPYYDYDNEEEMENALRRMWYNLTHSISEYERLQSTINFMKSEKRRDAERDAKGHEFIPGTGGLSFSHKYCDEKETGRDHCRGLEKNAIHHRGEIQVPGGTWVKLDAS